MARFGDYEGSREVYRGGLAVVYTARGPGGPEERFAVKVLELPVYLADEERVELESGLFIEAAETQKRAAAAGGWAPVHASGRCEGGAWYATDLFERSAEKLVLHRRELEPAELFRVIDAVVQGLISLRNAESRPHGNLKTTNVLVSGRGDVSGSRIVLSDPIPTSRVKPEEDTLKDLRDLGDLLHQLVLHRPMRSAVAWPLSLTTEWQRLGRVGEGWLELCNALLNPTGAPPPLDEIARFLPELSAKPGTGSSPSGAGAAAQGSGPVTPTPRPPSRTPGPGMPTESRADFHKSRPASGVLPDAGPGSEPGATPLPSGSSPMLKSGSGVGSGPGLSGGSGVGPATPVGSGSHPGSSAPAAPALGASLRRPSEIPAKAQSKKPTWRLYAAAGAGVLAIAVVAAVFWPHKDDKKPITPGGGTTTPGGTDPVEPEFTEVDPRDKAFKSLVEEAGTGAAKIRDLLKATAPNVDLGSLEGAITKFTADRKAVEALAWNRAGADKVKEEVARLRTEASALKDLTVEKGKESPDPRVKWRGEADRAIADAQVLKQSLSSDPKLGPAIDEEIGRLRTLYTDADPSSPAWKANDENKAARTYAKALEDGVSALATRSKEIWQQVPNPRTPELFAAADAALAKAREIVGALTSVPGATPGNVPALLAAYEKKRADEDLAKREWTLSNKGAIDAWVKDLREGAPTLAAAADKAWAQAPDPRVKARADADAAIKTLGRDEDNARAAGLTAEADAMKTAREALDASLKEMQGVDWRPSNREPMAAAVTKVNSAVAGLGDAKKKLADAIKANQERMAAMKKARQDGLRKDAAALLAQINAGKGPSDTGTDGPDTLADRYKRLAADEEFAAVNTDPGVDQVGKRLAALNEIGTSADPAFLLKKLGEAGASGQVAEGRLALSKLVAPGLKNFPATAQDLTTAAGAIRALREGGRAKDFDAQFASAGKTMWRSYMANLDFSKPADVKIAREIMPTLGLKDADLAELGGRERFNFLMMDLKSGLAGADEAAARALVAKFRTGVGALDAPTQARPEIGAVMAALDQAINVEVPKIEPVDLTKLGPGSKGWPGVESKDARGIDVVTFTKGNVTITFARSGEGSMVSTTEVSLAQFIAAAEGAGKWAEVMKLMPPKGALFRGPRVWFWSVEGERIEPIPDDQRKGYSKGWLAESADRIATVYPPAVLDSIQQPGPSDPIQYVSPAAGVYVAGLLGSRLPTAQEWADAVAVEERANGTPKPNLRDVAWDEVRKYAVTQSQLPENKSRDPNWPDEDVFKRRADTFPVGSKAEPASTSDDGTVWFAPVDQGGGTLFHHLVGNVAEFVYEKGPELEGTELTPEVVIAKVGTNTDGSLKVIGASALSPAQFKPTEGAVPDRLDLKNPGARRWCDVGFRLAFTARSGPPKPKPLADRVREAAGAVAFLPVR